MADMATEDSLNHSMNSALKHYSSMFFLPSSRKAVGAVAGLCIGVVGPSTFALFLSIEGLISNLFIGLISSLFLGVSLFATTIIFDYVTSKTVFGNDPIYVLRRTVALSLFCWILWLFFIIPGVAFGAVFNLWQWWVKLCILGFAAVLTFRAVVFISTSSVALSRRLVSSLLQPFLCIAVFVVFWNSLDSTIPLQILPFLVISPIVSCASAFLFVFLIDRLGRRMYDVPSMPLFRAFMLNWVAGLNAPFEGLLEKLGENEDIEVALLKFDSYKPKAAIIVPLVHPGPFKNIGSSLLPSMLKHEFEKEFGCDTCVPLGILGHELDLASQAQNQKIISHVINSAKFASSADRATPFVKVTDGFATASCQVFENTAFLSFTLAPKTTEDLPQQLGQIVREEAEKHGLNCNIVVNAHNSIDDTVDVEASLETLHAVASKCLEKAVSLPSYPFEVGAATVFPKEFDLKDGMGPGGITAVVVQVAEQKTAYVVIDGNNMVSGLREEILSALKAAGFHASEVFTTDTHAVSAVVLGRRGYHPVGEVMNHETLISYIQEAAKTAAARLEHCKAGCLRMVVPEVRVIGKARLESLSMLVDKALQRAKQIVVPIFALEGLILILLLTLL
jgi:putative membrane protein